MSVIKNKIEIKNNIKLLKCMVQDQEQQSAIYHPGPYWVDKARTATDQLITHGLKYFRGNSNDIGNEFADNTLIDIRDGFTLGWKRKIASWLTKQYPLNRVYDAQVACTKRFATRCNQYIQEIVDLSPRTAHLVHNYKLPYSLLGGSECNVCINDKRYSAHYLMLLDQHDHLSEKVNFKSLSSVFEIGPGFGVNIHLLIENYPNIKKFLYLDIPPNLYVGTQYLKAFYGNAIKDYESLRDVKELRFTPNDELEVLCIAPWQIECFRDSVDLLMNAYSFVEMPKKVVENYVEKFKKFPDSDKTKIALISYASYDLKTTYHPDELPLFFKDINFDKFERDIYLKLDAFTKKNYMYVST
ncbi:MAG: putative sugar O-methyltransferase [bacterium]